MLQNHQKLKFLFQFLFFRIKNKSIKSLSIFTRRACVWIMLVIYDIPLFKKTIYIYIHMKSRALLLLFIFYISNVNKDSFTISELET